MDMKIVKITKQEIKPSKLADGWYTGIQGGYEVVIQLHDSTYTLEVDEGVRGIGYKVVVQIIEGDVHIHDLQN